MSNGRALRVSGRHRTARHQDALLPNAARSEAFLCGRYDSSARLRTRGALLIFAPSRRPRRPHARRRGRRSWPRPLRPRAAARMRSAGSACRREDLHEDCRSPIGTMVSRRRMLSRHWTLFGRWIRAWLGYCMLVLWPRRRHCHAIGLGRSQCQRDEAPRHVAKRGFAHRLWSRACHATTAYNSDCRVRFRRDRSPDWIVLSRRSGARAASMARAESPGASSSRWSASAEARGCARRADRNRARPYRRER